MKADGAPFPTTLKPWWKSVGFWMGALVAVFLGWVMVWSANRSFFLIKDSPNILFALSTSSGSLCLESSEEDAGLNIGSEWIANSVPNTYDGAQVGMAGRWTLLQGNDDRRTWFSVPLWFLFLMWGALWFGAWMLRRNWICRKMTEAAESISGADG